MKDIDALLILLIILLICLICKKQEGFKTMNSPEYVDLKVNIPDLYD